MVADPRRSRVIPCRVSDSLRSGLGPRPLHLRHFLEISFGHRSEWRTRSPLEQATADAGMASPTVIAGSSRSI